MKKIYNLSLIGAILLVLNLFTSCEDTKAYKVNNGYLDIEIESLPKTLFNDEKWELATDFDGFSGTGYAIWEGEAIWGNDSQPDDDEDRYLKFQIEVDEPGTYFIKLVNYHLNHDGDNDVFIKSSGSQYDGYAKYYDSDKLAWTLDETSEWAVHEFIKGENTIEIVGRSHGFAIDKIIIHKKGLVLPQPPVNPNASAEAKQLLQYLYKIKQNKGILSGMHNELDMPTMWDDSLLMRNGNIQPAIWGSDFRYGKHIKHRQRMIDEAIKQHEQNGKIITLMYHQARPMDDEDCCGDDIWKASIQGDITDAELDSTLTVGTELYNKWKQKLDTVSSYLQQLEDRKIPILFRPYHEMNGDWFWWGAKAGYPEEGGEERDQSSDRYKELYKMTYHYLTDEKKLDNLIWVLNYDDDNNDLHLFYPGDNYVDAVATDVYFNKHDVNGEHYKILRRTAGEKPMAFGEVSVLPEMETLKTTYSDFVWFMGWRKLFFEGLNDVDEGHSPETLKKIFEDDYTINSEDIDMN